MASIEEKLTEQFLRWEMRGRGWQLWDVPVAPEPAFTPFRRASLSEQAIVDDGRKPTALSSFVRNLGHRLSGEKAAPKLAEAQAEEEPQPRLFRRNHLVELEVSLPAKRGLDRDAIFHLITGLSSCFDPIAFELVAEPGRISCQLVVHPDDEWLVHEQLSTLSSEVRVQRREAMLRGLWRDFEDGRESIVECGLAREFMLPIARSGGDPLTAVVGALGGIGEGESAIFQVIFEPVRHQWAEGPRRQLDLALTTTKTRRSQAGF